MFCRAGYDAARAREKRGGPPSGVIPCFAADKNLSFPTLMDTFWFALSCCLASKSILSLWFVLPDALITAKAGQLLGQLEKAWADGPGKPGSGMLGKTFKVEFELRLN